MSGEQNLLCNKYVNLVCLKKNLQLENKNIQNAIEDVEAKIDDETRLKIQVNREEIINEFNSELKENLKLLDLRAVELSKELIDLFKKTKNLNKQSELLEKMLKKNEDEKHNYEAEINEKIHEMREDFHKKYSEFLKAKSQYEKNQKFLQENQILLVDCENVLNEKKIELNEVNEINKRHDNSKEQRKSEKYSKKLNIEYKKIENNLNELTAIADCKRDKIFEVQKEIKIVRNFFRKKLNFIEKQNEWSAGILLKRKLSLEDSIIDAYKLMKLMNQIRIIEENVN